ncbi:MAG: serine hydrolase [Bacteroidetes bacterium]|nr:serine hydrolase [Bacteroidota bacterium]
MNIYRKFKFVFYFLIMSLLSSCHVVRFVFWNMADINDYKKFPSYKIKKKEPVFNFYEAATPVQLKIPKKFETENHTDSFENFLEDHKTVAFLIIRNDTVIYEKYFKKYNHNSILPSFSVSKSYVSALMGIAISEGYISDTNQPITDFVHELKDDKFKKITIENLLNMRSGIKFSEAYLNPFGQMAKYYYGTNLKKYITKLKVKEPPGINYEYMSVNTQLLALAIENATGRKFTDYFEEKIWQPIGMESDASWNYDSKKHGTIKAFCGLNARAIDFAKFGRLYLNKGIWNGKQIIPEEWVIRSTSIINNSLDSQNYPYTYFWRAKEDGAFFAKGVLGQYIYVFPEKNLIFLRLGKKYGKINWADLFEEISKQL